MSNPNLSEVDLESLKTEAGRVVKRSSSEVESFVVNNPIPTILGALAIGMSLAFLLTRHRPTVRERYVNDPIGELSDLLQGAGKRLNRGAQQGYDEGVSGIEKAIQSLRRLF